MAHSHSPVVTGRQGAQGCQLPRPPAGVHLAGPVFGGVPGTIGGDRSAWYTGLAGGAVTSVALWDTRPGPHGAATMTSLAGLGGVPATDTASWPTGIWATYVKSAR